jgi:bifunctional ADP-heptose synthase (sugar kinase/adenylyltransferase)
MNQHEALRNLIERVYRRVQERKLSIAVVGDMILDNLIEAVPGDEHPMMRIPILHEATNQESIGGAANIALALSRLGVEVSLFGIIGSDLTGRLLENLLDRQSINNRLITQRGWPTPRKDWLYYRHAGGQLELKQRIDYDRPVPGSAREELVGEFRARRPPDLAAVILADHGLGCIGPESLPLIGLAREQQAKVVAIPRSNVLRGQPLTAIVVGGNEMNRFLGVADNIEAQQSAARYAREMGQHVFMTLLAEGLVVCPAGTREPRGIAVPPGFPLENPNWVGVRDITTVCVAMGLALGLEPLEVGRFSVVFRHLVASQRGNGRVVWQDVFRLVGSKMPDEP